MISGLYVPGQSLMHRLPAGTKLLGLLIISTGLFFISAYWMMAIFCGLVAIIYALSGFAWQMIWLQTKPIRYFLLLFFVFQWWTVDLDTALLVFFRMLGLIWLAALFTLTTTTQSLVSALERCFGLFRPLGLPSHKISLTISLAIRFIPLLAQTQRQIREAQAARGAKAKGFRSAFSAVLPTLIHTIRQADMIAEAIEARGYQDK